MEWQRVATRNEVKGQMKTFCIAISMMLLAGCTTPRSDTMSGRPEVTVDAPRTKVKAALANELVNRRFVILNDGEFTMFAEGDASAGANFWFGNALTGEMPRTRMRFTLIEQDSKTRVIGTAAMAYAAGLSGRQSEWEAKNPRTIREVQYLLDCVAADSTGVSRPEKPQQPKAEPVHSGKY